MSDRPMIEAKVFTLPGDERLLNQVFNDPNSTVVDELKVPCPKEGIILVYIKIERWEGGGVLD